MGLHGTTSYKLIKMDYLAVDYYSLNSHHQQTFKAFLQVYLGIEKERKRKLKGL